MCTSLLRALAYSTATVLLLKGPLRALLFLQLDIGDSHRLRQRRILGRLHLFRLADRFPVERTRVGKLHKVHAVLHSLQHFVVVQNGRLCSGRGRAVLVPKVLQLTSDIGAHFVDCLVVLALPLQLRDSRHFDPFELGRFRLFALWLRARLRGRI